MRLASRRLLSTAPVLLGVVVIVFILTRVLPGDPARTLAGDQADASTIERLRTQMGLDLPLWQQFINYVGGLLHGDLGFAWHTSHSVAEDFATRFPATVELALAAIVIALIVGIPIGILGAVRRDKLSDHIGRVMALVGASMPLFWLGLMIIFIFYGVLGIEPAPIGRVAQSVNPPTDVTGLYVLDSLLSGDMTALRSSLAHLFWPALCLATGSMAMISRMTRSAMLEVIGQDYVRTAEAKGLPPARVILKHALRNAAPTTVTVVGLQLGQLLGGAVLTETIFAWPGIGSYVTASLLATDYAPVQAFTLLAAIIFLAINLLVDLANAWLDPKVRHA